MRVSFRLGTRLEPLRSWVLIPSLCTATVPPLAVRRIAPTVANYIGAGAIGFSGSGVGRDSVVVVGCLDGWPFVGDSVSASRVDRLPCVGLDGLSHRCGSGCLPIVARGLPLVAGYRWRYGSTARGCWSLWLERIGGGGGRWFVLDRPAAESARELVAVIHAYGQGARGVIE